MMIQFVCFPSIDHVKAQYFDKRIEWNAYVNIFLRSWAYWVYQLGINVGHKGV